MSQVGRDPWGWLRPTPGSTPENQILFLRVLSKFSLNSIRSAITATLHKQLKLLKYIPGLCSCLPQGTATHLNYANGIKMSRTGCFYVSGINRQQSGWQKNNNLLCSQLSLRLAPHVVIWTFPLKYSVPTTPKHKGLGEADCSSHPSCPISRPSGCALWFENILKTKIQSSEPRPICH